MADKYCIKSGSYTDTAIWAASENGSGGAAAPVRTDTIIITKNVVVSDAPASLGNIALRDGTTLTLNPASDVSRFDWTASQNALVQLGRNAVLNFGIWARPYANRLTMGENARIHAGTNLHLGRYVTATATVPVANYSIAPSARFSCDGSQIRLYSSRDGNTWSIPPGFYEQSTLIISEGAEATPFRLASGAYDFRELAFWTRNSGALLDVAATGATIRTGPLTLNPDTESGIRLDFSQCDFEVAGDIVYTAVMGPVDLVREIPVRLVGTQDQALEFPSCTDGLVTLVPDKVAGAVDLVRFNGRMQGRLRTLIVRAASSIDLAGASPYLETSFDVPADYAGLQADATPLGVPRQSTPVEDRLREAMDSCDNYGTITIPAGKTLCTKLLRNHDGAVVEGEGTLLIRYGGLSGSGTVDPGVDLRFFDHPIAASLSGEDVARPFAVYTADFSASVGLRFRLDWGDGTFSEAAAPGGLTHVYTAGNESVSRTLVLTVVNEDGTTRTASKTITVQQYVHAVELSLSPASGSVPLSVLASVQSPSGRSYTIDWGDGLATGPTASTSFEHTYFASGRYNVTATAADHLGNPAETTRPVVALDPPPEPIDVALTLSVPSGRVPLTVVASAESQNGVLFAFDWGNGQRTGPAAASTASQTYYDAAELSVTATAYGASGNRADASLPLTILPPADPSEALIRLEPALGDAPLTVVAKTTGSRGAAMRIDWGDGTEPSDPVPMTEIWSHEYDEAGEYLVRLTVWNEQDVATEVRAVVRVLTPAAIRALLDIRPGTGYAPLTILADATGSSGTEWTFAWGDGTFDGPSAETARTHTFHDPGYYVVTLTVTRDDLVETAARGIVVELSPSIPVDPAAPLRYESGLIRKQRLNAGIPRDDLPFPYRLTLAHGVWSMQDTIQLHCPTNETGRALENGSALFLGRITHSDASAVLPEEIAAASYTVFRLDDSDPGVRTPVEGHAAVPLAPGDVLFAEFVKDANWPFDETGYNFRCILDDSLDAPFPTAGRNYLVVFTLEPESMPPRILLQYRVHVV